EIKEVLLKALDTLDNPIIILEKPTRNIVYSNEKGKALIEEVNRQGICLNLDPFEEKNLILTLDKPFPQIFFGKCKPIGEDYLLLYFQELKKDKPFSGFLYELIEELPVLVFFIKNGRIFYVNKTVETLLGYKREEVIGKSIIKDLMWEIDIPKAEVHCKRVMQGIKESGFIIALKTPEGRLKNLIWNCFLTADWEGEPIVVGIAADITEYLELSKKLENLHKTQTFTEFLRGLVHDFNNVLQSILSYLNQLRNVPVSRMEEILRAIEKNINSWIDINRILIDYTRESKEIREKKIDLVQFLKENLEVFQLILGENIRLHINLGFYKKLCTYGDSAFWRYIFLNLLKNSKDAIEGEGDIFIYLSTYEDTQKLKRYVKLSVKDTGSGIPEEILPKIFDPFFTTKEKGSGLGLFLVKHHIKNLEGFIEVESSPGKGTTFFIYVPLCEERLIFSPKELSLKDKVFIIVEDEEEILENLRDLLQEEGAKVYTFTSGKALLSSWDNLEKPHLLIIDLNLPDIGGREIAISLKEKDPSLKILYITGDIFALSEIPEEKVLLKPFKIEELFEKIKKNLNE
ncbi:MAG: hybrid sensor histidine kinase/response regulator, partial [Caldimicrobium thiodismutans]